MGRVWAAKRRTGTGSAGGAGDWVAVKMIPINGDASLQNALRECLSTFRDLSPTYVVRYESYWLEEATNLPDEVRCFFAGGEVGGGAIRQSRLPPPCSSECGSSDGSSGDGHLSVPPGGKQFADVGACAVPAYTSKKLCSGMDDEDLQAPLTLSLRFREGNDMSNTRKYSDLGLEPSFVNTECGGFVFEGSTVDDFSPHASPTRGRHHVASCSNLPRAVPESAPAPVLLSSVATTSGDVLLIEMELMSDPPDDAPGSVGAERRMTLRFWLRNHERTFSDAADVFGPLMLAVRHIHRKRIIHADLKPDNIFCVEETRSGRVTVVRIGDFGLAGENQLFLQGASGRALGGTPGYAAPEVLRPPPRADTSPEPYRTNRERRLEQCTCSDKADIFACAVILLELLLVPVRTQMERATFLEMFHARKAVPDFIDARLPKTRELLRDMGDHDPAMRPSAEEVLKRFEKEVRKELCRSATQSCCSPTFSDSLPPWRSKDKQKRVPPRPPPPARRPHGGNGSTGVRGGGRGCRGK